MKSIQIGRKLDGDRQIDGWIDRQTDGYTDRQIQGNQYEYRKKEIGRFFSRSFPIFVLKIITLEVEEKSILDKKKMII